MVAVAEPAEPAEPALDAPPSPGDHRRAGRADLVAAGGAVVLVAAAMVVGRTLVHRGVPLLVGFPPLLAAWDPHVGPGTPAAILVAAVVITAGPGYAATRPWRRVLAVAWAGALLWTVSLALVDGFRVGFADRLTTVTEYLHEVPRIRAMGLGTFLERFTALVPNTAPGFWTTHVAGHPPLATLVFVWLDEIGLSGGAAAAWVVVVVGSSATVAMAVALRALGVEDAARRFLPFGVLFPGAVWVGVSADGLFAAVLAWGVALTALACARDRAGRPGAAVALGVAAGLVLGATLFLNYGLAVALLVPFGVVALTGAWRVGPPVVVGGGAVAAAFAVGGFWWFDGYRALLLRYAEPGEFGGLRPYSYFVWADLAALVLVVGPAVVAGLGRVAAEHPWRRGTTAVGPWGWTAVAVLAATALVAVVVADLSGLSKAEVERIWLPFAVCLLPVTALLGGHRARWWLAAQAVVALVVNHLLLTVW